MVALKLNNIYDALYPLHLMATLSGLLSFTYNNHLRCFVQNKVLLCADILIVLAFAICFLLVSHEGSVDQTRNAISNVSAGFQLYASTISQLIGVFMNCIYAKRLIRMFSQLDNMDSQLSQLGAKLDYKSTFVFSLAGVAGGILELLITLPTDYFFFITDESTLFIITNYAPIVINAFNKMQFLTFVYLLYERFHFINERISFLEFKINQLMNYGNKKHQKKVYKGKEDIILEYIYILRFSYKKLWKISVWVNRIYGLQILLTAATAFAIVTTQYYLIYESIRDLIDSYSWNKITSIYFSLQWSSIQIFEILVCLHYCNKTRNTIKECGITLHDLQIIEGVNVKILEQLKLFSLQVMMEDVQFTALNLFQLDNTLLHSILSATTTYLVVMVQYDIATRANKTNLANSLNDVEIYIGKHGPVGENSTIIFDNRA